MDSYRLFAQRRDLELMPATGMEPLTPLLDHGGSLDPAARGSLAPGIEGIVGRLEYTGGGSEGGGGRFMFNVAITEIPESQAFVPRLFCIRRGRITDNVHYGFEIRQEALWTESEVLNERYKVTTGPFQDANWMRQLFSPTLIDWLATVPPDDFSFELAYGWLLGSVERDQLDPDQLDALCEATGHVAGRVREECAE